MSNNIKVSSATARGQRLKRLRNIANLSRKDFEEQYNIKLNTLKGWEVGRHGGLTEKGAVKILQILEKHGVRCELQWIMFGEGKGPVLTDKFYNKNVAEKKAAYNEEQQIINELLCFKQASEHAIDFIVVDCAMEPCYKKGDIVAGIKRYDHAEIDKLCGQDCIVQTDKEETILRNIHSREEDGTYTLSCHNMHAPVKQPFLYGVKIISAAPVIWVRRKNP